MGHPRPGRQGDWPLLQLLSWPLMRGLGPGLAAQRDRWRARWDLLRCCDNQSAGPRRPGAPPLYPRAAPPERRRSRCACVYPLWCAVCHQIPPTVSRTLLCVCMLDSSRRLRTARGVHLVSLPASTYDPLLPRCSPLSCYCPCLPLPSPCQPPPLPAAACAHPINAACLRAVHSRSIAPAAPCTAGGCAHLPSLSCNPIPDD